jgi:hypothetical protein
MELSARFFFMFDLHLLRLRSVPLSARWESVHIGVVELIDVDVEGQSGQALVLQEKLDISCPA